MSSIFGSPSSGQNQSTSTSSNQAYPMLSTALSGQVSNGAAANNGLSSMLGLGGDPTAQNQAFQNFQNSTGYQFGLNQGSQAVSQNAAVKGTLNSGATAKALDTYGQNYANTQYQNYTNLLTGQQNAGTQAAATIGSTGQTSNSNSSGTQTGDSSKEADSKLGFAGALL